METIKELYSYLFRRQWPAWVGGIVMGFIIPLMFVWGAPWAVTNGILVWGDNILKPILYPDADVQSPIWQFTALINWAFLLGAFISALLGGDFRISIPSFKEFLMGAFGGTLMGIGAFLAFGCTIGAFLVGFGALSASGLTMMIGLGLGTYTGLRLYMWLLTKGWGTPGRAIEVPVSLQVILGIVLVVITLGLIAFLDKPLSTFSPALGLGSVQLAAGSLIFFGVVLGIVNQRTRFCFVRAFREPFMTGEGNMTRAAALALIIAAVFGVVVKFSPLTNVLEIPDVKDILSIEMTAPPSIKAMMVAPSFPIGSLIGGFIFGIGMTLAGGCSVGSFWRAGEGSLKNMTAILFYALGGSVFAFFYRKIEPAILNAFSGLYEKLGASNATGIKLFLPDAVGLGWAVVIFLAFA
ncbi:YeeE/YedE thiosulfate transporter family protein, partial [Hydrogenivirga sp.]